MWPKKIAMDFSRLFSSLWICCLLVGLWFCLELSGSLGSEAFWLYFAMLQYLAKNCYSSPTQLCERLEPKTLVGNLQPFSFYCNDFRIWSWSANSGRTDTEEHSALLCKILTGIIMFSLNLFSLWKWSKSSKPCNCCWKSQKIFLDKPAFTEINYSNPVDCNRKKLGSLPEKCKYILLLEQYDNYDPFNDPFTVIIIGNDNALVDWSYNGIFIQVCETFNLKSFEPNYWGTVRVINFKI